MVDRSTEGVTVHHRKGVVPDERGVVAIEFEIEALNEFIKAFNEARPRGYGGATVQAVVVGIEPGRAELLITSSKPGERR